MTHGIKSSLAAGPRRSGATGRSGRYTGRKLAGFRFRQAKKIRAILEALMLGFSARIRGAASIHATNLGEVGRVGPATRMDLLIRRSSMSGNLLNLNAIENRNGSNMLVARL